MCQNSQVKKSSKKFVNLIDVILVVKIKKKRWLLLKFSYFCYYVDMQSLLVSQESTLLPQRMHRQMD